MSERSYSESMSREIERIAKAVPACGQKERILQFGRGLTELTSRKMSLEEADQIHERIKCAIETNDKKAKKAFDLVVRTQLRLAREYKKATS